MISLIPSPSIDAFHLPPAHSIRGCWKKNHDNQSHFDNDHRWIWKTEGTWLERRPETVKTESSNAEEQSNDPLFLEQYSLT